MLVIETKRLEISRLELTDAGFIHQLVNDPDFIHYIGDRQVRTIDDARGYIEKGPLKSYSLNGFGLYSIKVKDSDMLIGICGLIKRTELEDIDIGYAFLSQYRGKGYAYEATEAVLEYGKNELRLKRIIAITTTDNLPSIRLLEKAGFGFEKMILMSGETAEIKLFAVNF